MAMWWRELDLINSSGDLLRLTVAAGLHEWAQGVEKERKEPHELSRQLLRGWKRFVQIGDKYLQEDGGE